MSDLELSLLREAALVAERGDNLVFVAPPSPGSATPVLAAVLRRLQAEPKGLVLALSPGPALDEWARLAERLASGSRLRIAGAHSPGRLTRLITSDAVDLAFASPETAHELVRRSALKMDVISALILLWPEAWGGDEPIVALLQDLPKDTQRILVTGDAAATAELAERYCWRAPVVDLVGAPLLHAAPAIRSAPASWHGRLEVLGDLVEQLDPESLAVWTADPGAHAAITHALAARGIKGEITGGIPVKAALIVAYDLPAPDRLATLVAQGDVVILVPPGTEAYAARLAPNRRPIHPTGALDRARTELEITRRAIATAASQGATPAAYHALAPLLERYEASAIAAVLYELWDKARSAIVAPSSVLPRSAAAGTKLWIGVGKRDDATPNDVVGTLLKELGVPREAIGRVEMRDTFSLVELTGVADPEHLAEQLTGKTIRKRRLVARVDRGRKDVSGKRA